MCQHLTGEKADTEDDILHIRHLPDFGGQLRSKDAELLLSYLTAPYLRIPLVLQVSERQRGRRRRSLRFRACRSAKG